MRGRGRGRIGEGGGTFVVYNSWRYISYMQILCFSSVIYHDTNLSFRIAILFLYMKDIYFHMHTPVMSAPGNSDFLRDSPKTS